MTLVTLTVGKPAHGGHCIARHEGRAVFVRGALPSEIVVAEVVDPDPTARFWNARTVEVLEASVDRVEHPWADAREHGVGGADLGHVSLAAQREWKAAIVREAFERFAGVDYTGGVKAADGDDERGGLHYRTRVSAIADAQGRASMAAVGGGERFTLTSMPLAVPEAEAALLAARAAPGERIEVAASSTGHIVIGSGPSTRGAKFRERIDLGDRVVTYDLRISDFWQVHREAPATLVEEVLRRVGDADHVLDLYAGVGLFAMALAAQGRDVTAVELGKPGTTSLEKNLARWPGSRAVIGDARRSLLTMLAEGRTMRGGAIVLDPPRVGAKEATIDAIARLEADTIVYVACDPVALARDTALLAARSYHLGDAQAWDLFPMTHHIETVATFTRQAFTD